MFLLQDSGEAGKPQKAFFMSKCLMLMHLHIVVPKYPHFIDVLNVRNNATMNKMGSFSSLVFSTLNLVVLIMLLLYFTKDFLSLPLQKESCDAMVVLQDFVMLCYMCWRGVRLHIRAVRHFHLEHQFV